MSTAIKPEIVALAAIVRDQLSLGANGVVEVKEGAFAATLPEGLTLEQVDTVQKHQADLVSATGLALGEIGLAAFKANPELQQVTVNLPTLKDEVSGTFLRSKEVAAGTGKDAGTQTKYGYLTMKVGVNAHANKGTLKKVKDKLSEEARALLAS